MQRHHRVIIIDCDHGSIDPEEAVFKDTDTDLTLANLKARKEIIQLCGNADGLIVQYAVLDKDILKELTKCKVISRYGVGVDTIDVEAATDLGIIVTNVPDYGVEEVSNHAVSLLMTSYRKILKLNNSVRSGNWDYRIGDTIISASKTKVGTLGLGRIGTSFAKKIKSLGFEIISYDPHVSENSTDIQMVDFETLVKESDFISIHCSLNPNTYHCLGEIEFKMMKDTSVIINTSRGVIIEEIALIKALQRAWIAGAALDVLEKEPPDSSNPLLSMDNVIITPHIAWFSFESRLEMKKKTAENVKWVLNGRVPYSVVNPSVLFHARANISAQ